NGLRIVRSRCAKRLKSRHRPWLVLLALAPKPLLKNRNAQVELPSCLGVSIDGLTRYSGLLMSRWKKCKVDGCQNVARHKGGICDSHFSRLKRTGRLDEHIPIRRFHRVRTQ